MKGRFVVDRYLVTGLDLSQREKDQLAMERPGEGVRRTTVIDVMSAVSTSTSVNTPAIIDAADSQEPATCAPLSFCIRDSFAGVWCNLAPAREG